MSRSEQKVIADISCDIGGSIELTCRATSQDDPAYVYDPEEDVFHDGYEGPGIAVLASASSEAQEFLGWSRLPFGRSVDSSRCP